MTLTGPWSAWANSPDHNFHGTISELRLYNGTLQQRELQALRQNRKGAGSLSKKRTTRNPLHSKVNAGEHFSSDSGAGGTDRRAWLGGEGECGVKFVIAVWASYEACCVDH